MRPLYLVMGLLVAGCGWTEPQNPAAEKKEAAAKRADARAVKQACGSQVTFERLKALAFDEAVKVRRAESPALQRLAAASVIRMEDPVAKSRDEALNVTVCTGRLILELPPGAEDVFDGDRRLEADVEYAAQGAADGSGLVFQMQGAEPIIYRLAAFDLPAGGRVPPVPVPTPTGLASADPVTLPAPVEAPPALPAARPEPRPAPPPAPRAAAPAPKAAPAPRPAPAVVERPRAAPKPSPTYRTAPPVEARPRAVARPSFNCSYARSRVERMICSDPDLARADRAMSAEFYSALAEADPETRRVLRGSRDRFLSFRDRCGSAGCVAQAYSDRIAEIRDIAAEGF